MLFYNQIKREFSNILWKRGQETFLAKRVIDVRLKGHRVTARISNFETSITVARGTIVHSVCSCRNAPKLSLIPVPVSTGAAQLGSAG